MKTIRGYANSFLLVTGFSLFAADSVPDVGCSMNFGSAKVFHFGRPDSVVISHAPRYSWFGLKRSCEGTQMQMRSEIAAGVVSIPQCIANIRYKCSNTDTNVFLPCLQYACSDNKATKTEEKAPGPETSLTNLNKSSAKNSVMISISSSRFLISIFGLIAALALIGTAVAWKVNKQVNIHSEALKGPKIPDPTASVTAC
jgi:hypothetical protein